MITLERAKEIFSDKVLFKLEEKGKLSDYSHRRKFDYAYIKNLSVDGKWHYSFRIKETEHNECATIDFSMWHPMCSKVCCFDICDEGFLLTVIDLCKNGLAC
jgi:hypothetical protein